MMDASLSNFLRHYSVATEQPDLRALCEIARAFSFLPYENVTKILKESHSVSAHSKLRQAGEVFDDHLRWRTGGTCFSLCNALQALLTQAGYCSFIAMGDMHYGKNIHCAVIVDLSNKRFLLDPGYLLHTPIALPAEGLESRLKTPMNTIVLRSDGVELFSLYTHEGGELKWRYRLRAVPTSEAAFVKHWLTSFSRNTMENLMLSRLEDRGRIYFRKDRLDLVSNGKREKRILSTEDFRELSNVFGLPADLILEAQNALLGRVQNIHGKTGCNSNSR